MKKQLAILVLLLVSTLGFAQETNYKEYSFTQLFEMIATETDSVFELKDALILFDPKIDSLFAYKRDGVTIRTYNRTDTIYINKELRFDNVQFKSFYGFGTRGVINHMVFNESVHFSNSVFGYIDHCTFKKAVKIEIDDKLFSLLEKLNATNQDDDFNFDIIRNGKFEEGISYFSLYRGEKPIWLYFEISDSEINERKKERRP